MRTLDAADYTELWNTMRENISLVKGKNLGSGEGTFNHIASGYDAGYYGYTYSLVFASDMYQSVFKADPLSPELGTRYRNAILQPGGSRDEHDSLKVCVVAHLPLSRCSSYDRSSSGGRRTRRPS